MDSFAGQSNSSFAIFGGCPEAVSYTHLDVYKRQAQAHLCSGVSSCLGVTGRIKFPWEWKLKCCAGLSGVALEAWGRLQLVFESALAFAYMEQAEMTTPTIPTAKKNTGMAFLATSRMNRSTIVTIADTFCCADRRLIFICIPSNVKDELHL